MCTEIPDEQKYPELHKIITTLMMHGPCGTSNVNSLCMIDGHCSEHFSKEFVDKTYAGDDGYPHYRRRNYGKCVEKNHVSLDNKYVVLYNPYLSVKYNADINVEMCSSIISCKYLYKYVYKGPDMASVAVEAENENPSKGSSKDVYKFQIHDILRGILEDLWL